MNWKCKKTWKQSKINTLWCLLGCSIGDFGTIFYFQNIEHSWSNFEIMGLAIINGLLTSIILETIILLKQMNFYLFDPGDFGLRKKIHTPRLYFFRVMLNR